RHRRSGLLPPIRSHVGSQIDAFPELATEVSKRKNINDINYLLVGVDAMGLTCIMKDNVKALIIAAGQGSRLRRWEGERPKHLYKVAGLTLIERAILSAKKAGITEFVVVIGYKGEVIRRKLTKRQAKLGVSIEFVENPDWTKSNCHSVLKARELLTDDFVLM